MRTRAVAVMDVRGYVSQEPDVSIFATFRPQPIRRTRPVETVEVATFFPRPISSEHPRLLLSPKITIWACPHLPEEVEMEATASSIVELEEERTFSLKQTIYEQIPVVEREEEAAAAAFNRLLTVNKWGEVRCRFCRRHC